jgi:hypothetical protein
MEEATRFTAGYSMCACAQSRSSRHYSLVLGLARLPASSAPVSKLDGGPVFRNIEIENTSKNLIAVRGSVLSNRAEISQKRWLSRTARRHSHRQIPLAGNVSTTLRWQAERDDGEHSGR